MGALVFILFLFSTFITFLLPRSLKYLFALLILSGMIILTSFWSYEAFNSPGQALVIRYSLEGYLNFPVLTIDRLSGFFILIINITVFTGILFAKGYLKSYLETKRQLVFSIHYFAYLWLYFSMLLVVMLRDGFAFLIVWELMSLSSFLLGHFRC